MVDSDLGDYCWLCGKVEDVTALLDRPESHEPACLWRRARVAILVRRRALRTGSQHREGTVPRSDRLLPLAGCHGVLRHHSIDSLAAYRAASSSQLACLHRFGSTIRRLVDRGDPGVMAALWPPRGI